MIALFQDERLAVALRRKSKKKKAKKNLAPCINCNDPCEPTDCCGAHVCGFCNNEGHIAHPHYPEDHMGNGE
jgi:hypothetical protein